MRFLFKFALLTVVYLSPWLNERVYWIVLDLLYSNNEQLTEVCSKFS